MSELFEKIVDGAGQVISGVDKGGRIQSAISGLRSQMAEADRKRKVNLVKQQIQDLQSREAQAINSLSAQVLALYEAGTLKQPELVSLCKGVDEIRELIKEREAELEQLQPQPQPQPEPQPQAQPTPHCPSCGVAVVAGAAFCQSCGARLKEEEEPAPILFCVHCGAKLRENSVFCPKCGEPVPGK
ncbi:MAG: zinc ribbon domain-containing protein [Anaerolineae bacterium]